MLAPKYETWTRLPLKDLKGDFIGFAERSTTYAFDDPEGARESAKRQTGHRNAIRQLGNGLPNIDVVAAINSKVVNFPYQRKAPVGTIIGLSDGGKMITDGLRETPRQKRRGNLRRTSASKMNSLPHCRYGTARTMTTRGLKLTTAITTTFKVMQSHIENIVRMGTYGAIIGKPGIGKSHLCECFAASDPNCIYVSASQGINVKYRPILKLIQQELRGELYLNAHRTTQDLEEEISCSLANDDYWLLIDESQNIDRGVIRTLLGFNDYLRGPNIPVVLIGNPQTLRSQRSDDFALDH